MGNGSRLIKAILGFAAVHQGVRTLGDALTPDEPEPEPQSLGRSSKSTYHGPRTQPSADFETDDAGSMRKVAVRNLDERVAHIVEFIEKGREDPQIRKLAVQAVSERCGTRWCTPPGNDRAEVNAVFEAASKQLVSPADHERAVKAVFDAMKPRYRYVRDPVHADMFQHPRRTLEMGGSDCDDATILMGSLLQSIGYPIRVRVIKTKGSPDWNHVYAVVGIPPEEPSHWVPLDLSMHHSKPAGWEAPKNMIAAVKDYEVPD